jgi:hypothetical protein
VLLKETKVQEQRQERQVEDRVVALHAHPCWNSPWNTAATTTTTLVTSKHSFKQPL